MVALPMRKERPTAPIGPGTVPNFLEDPWWTWFTLQLELRQHISDDTYTVALDAPYRVLGMTDTRFLPSRLRGHDLVRACSLLLDRLWPRRERPGPGARRSRRQASWDWRALTALLLLEASDLGSAHWPEAFESVCDAARAGRTEVLELLRIVAGGSTDPQRHVALWALASAAKRTESSGRSADESPLGLKRRASAPDPENSREGALQQQPSNATNGLEPGLARVLIVDDEPMIRRLIGVIVAEQPRARVVGEAASNAEALRLARSLHPDVVFTDVIRPGGDGIEFTRDLLALLPFANVIVVSSHGDGPHRLAALRSGASAAMAKPFEPRAMARVFDTVRHHGRTWGTRAAVESME